MAAATGPIPPIGPERGTKPGYEAVARSRGTKPSNNAVERRRGRTRGDFQAMRIRLGLTLAAAMAFAVSLPAPAAGVALVDESGGTDGWSRGTDIAPTGGTDTAPAGSTPERSSAAFSSWSGQYSVYRARTHAVQKADWYCVPASIQMMLNLINGTSDRSTANQTKYWQYAQDHSRYPIRDNGADAAGWAAALRHWGAGNYTVGIHNSMQASLRAAASRMRQTGKPVGMIVWGRNGGHAWVMTGFKSTADPRLTSSYTVTSVQAMGPLWPYGTIGGKSFDPGPREWVAYSELKNKFTEYVQRSAPAWNGRWLTVLP